MPIPGKIFRARVHPSITESTGEAQGSLFATPQSVAQHVVRNSMDAGRTVILEFGRPPGINIPIGATGNAWIASEKPHHILGLLDLVTGMLLRFSAAESYLKAMAFAASAMHWRISRDVFPLCSTPASAPHSLPFRTGLLAAPPATHDTAGRSATPPSVDVVTAHPQDIPVFQEWISSLDSEKSMPRSVRRSPAT